MICDRFDTAVVPFPFAEVPVVKRRPVVVLSSRAFNASHDASLVGMITTAKATEWPSDIAISDLPAAGLNVPCLIRLRLATVPNALILRGLGRLGAVDRLACERAVAGMIVG